MAIQLEAPAPTGIQRGRGGFYRNSQDTPYVSDPTGALVKSGERAGQVKRLAYGSPSSFGEQIANVFNLTKWGERMVALGVALGDDELRAACFNLAYLADDRDSKEFKAAADELVVRAKVAAEAHLDADRGTYMHAVVLENRVDRERGDALGINFDVEDELSVAFHQMVDDYGLEVLGVELPCVNDTLRLAGTCDAHVRLTRDLRMCGHGGEIVNLPAGTILVLDLKCGRLRTDNQGRVEYWRDYPIQIAAYAGSVPYDTEAETRGEWGYELNQDWALLAHLNTREAIAGEPAKCTLILVDIAAGRQAADVVVAAKAWEKRVDVMTIQPQTDAQVTRDLEASVAMIERESDKSDGAQPARESGPTPAEIAPESESVSGSGAPIAGEVAAAARATASPAPAAAAAPSLQRAVTEAAPHASVTADSPRADVIAALGGPTHVPDEGADLTADPRWDDLEATFLLLDEQDQAWFRELIHQANEASLRISAHHNRTERRYHIYAGLLTLIGKGANHAEIVRGLVALALDTDAALFPTITVGHAVGAMGAAEATRFAELCDLYVDDRLESAIPLDGFLRFRAA